MEKFGKNILHTSETWLKNSGGAARVFFFLVIRLWSLYVLNVFLSYLYTPRLRGSVIVYARCVYDTKNIVRSRTIYGSIYLLIGRKRQVIETVEIRPFNFSLTSGFFFLLLLHQCQASSPSSSTLLLDRYQFCFLFLCYGALPNCIRDRPSGIPLDNTRKSFFTFKFVQSWVAHSTSGLKSSSRMLTGHSEYSFILFLIFFLPVSFLVRYYGLLTE